MFETIFIQPLFNFLILIYNFLPIKDLGLAVIIFVIIIRLILYPVFKSNLKSQMVISKLQPEIAKLQKQYKNDQAKQAVIIGSFISFLYKAHSRAAFWASSFSFCSCSKR